LLLASGCNGHAPQVRRQGPTSAQTSGTPGQGQPLYASDEDALNAMMTAVKAQDHEQVHLILGPAWKELVSGDKVEDANAFNEFAHRAAERTRLQKQDDTTSILYVGNDDWPFPIPMAKTPDGKWFFDTEAGKTEILARRIGENELDTIQVCREYVAGTAGVRRQGSRRQRRAQICPEDLKHAGKDGRLILERDPRPGAKPVRPLVRGGGNGRL
jgi:hypothetical protein